MTTRRTRLIIGVLLLACAALFVATGLAVNDFGWAWSVLSGAVPPSGSDAPALAYSLSVTGYLIVPTLVGVAAASVVASVYNRRTLPHAEVIAEIARILRDTE